MAALDIHDSNPLEISGVCHELKVLLVQDLCSCARYVPSKQESAPQTGHDVMENFGLDFLDEYVGVEGF
ncbi:hypothetical protein LSH36_127g01018 [Paralvinella palmiformis]|uniref:Uncharacterized protein n=1 Tax=Paralvinella palmiformis TaxID=53620 RepID=A0AAD9NB45_9ANNE|nr:hypothetical protein LSH36_127g01018 [Paralvinella palmiformis]